MSRRKNIYKMKGCSKNKTQKKYLGGTLLAYTGKPVNTLPNPALAYTGKGGASCGLSHPTTIPINTNAENSAYPNTGPIANGNNTIFNNASTMSGGGCGCSLPKFSGGKKKKNSKKSCESCSLGFFIGGTRHRLNCKCSKCKQKIMKGGKVTTFVGPAWTPTTEGNYYALNAFKTDPITSIVDVGANRPFLYMKAGSSKTQKKKQRGGTLTNFIGQDLINVGRQIQFGIGSAYNTLAGYPTPVNPLPWRDQFPNKH